MRNSYAWTFGILFLAGFIILALNNFELPFILLGKKDRVNGKVIKIDLLPTKGGYLQIVKYAYYVNNNWYFDSKKIGKRFGYQHIGNRLLIDYSIKQPWKNNIKGVYHGFGSSFKTTYINGNKTGYTEIEFNNSIMYKREYALQGKLTKELIGDFVIINDTLIFKPFGILKDKSLEIQSIFNSKELYLKFNNDSLKSEELIDLKNDKKYLLIN